jgi:hypothetical protein
MLLLQILHLGLLFFSPKCNISPCPNFGVHYHSFKSLNFSDGDQPPKPVKALLKVEKNRDGKTGKTNLYFDYSRSRILTNEEYMDEFGEVMKI